jgi:Transposase.
MCDLDTHKPLEILKDRATKSLSQWLNNYSGVEIVTRDRANSYSKAVTEIATEAVQIADKWHLLRNMFDTMLKP